MGKKGTILFISHDASRTGAPIFLLNLLRWLRANTSAWQFKIILRAGGPLEAEFRELGPTTVREHALGDVELLEGVGLIYSNTCTNGAFIAGMPRGTIPVITHVHELEAVLLSYGWENISQVLRQSRQFVACSHSVGQALRKFGAPENKVQVLHAAIPAEMVAVKAGEISWQDLRRKHGWENQIIVVACGVADWRKGADLFLQVAERVRRRLTRGWGSIFRKSSRRIRFLWVGILPPDERGKMLQHDLQHLGLEDWVEFLGEQRNPYPYLNVCDLFCLPSREDPFPLVMLEAGSLGKPMVCFDKSGGAVELCAQGAGVAVPYLDLDAMADAIIQLARQKRRRKDIGTTAARVIKKQHDIAAIGPRIAELLQEHFNPAPSLDFASAQIYFPGLDGYSESRTFRQYFPEAQWVRLRFDCPQIPQGGQLRLDPVDQPAMVLIAGIRIKDKISGKALWHANRPAHFDACFFAHTLKRLPDDLLLVLSADNADPHFLLPPLATPPERLTLEVWLCAGNEAALARYRSASRHKTLANRGKAIKNIDGQSHAHIHQHHSQLPA